jgi:Na+-transporting NADH:ubiquinone oxidoreductase subunit C
MLEPILGGESVQQESKVFTTKQTIVFITIVSFVSAIILAFLASALRDTQKIAKELDRTKQMLIAAEILTHDGYFQIQENGKYVPAVCAGSGKLMKSDEKKNATENEIMQVIQARIKPFLVDSTGASYSFEEKKIDLNDYITKNKKLGYAPLPLKLAYEILPNPVGKGNESPDGYIIPIAGFGLWDYIYGYLAVKPDGNEVIGTSWYDQKETPGLGGVISEPNWQKLFPGKKIFQEDSSGNIDLKRSSIGLVIVKGKVVDVCGQTPRALSSIDGIAGATLTGNGVTRAYKSSLVPYRQFFIRLNEKNKK